MSNAEFCKDCERDVDDPQCQYCNEGSRQLMTVTVIRFAPTVTIGRVQVMRGSNKQYTLLPSMPDRDK